MAEGTAQSFLVLNYSGMLYNTSDTNSPFVNSLPRRNTDHVEFAISSKYAMATPSQPAIDETKSLTAPNPTYVTRDQQTNVTQIFQYTTAVSYAKQSNMGTMSGINVAGQSSNVQNEFDFQMGVKTAEARMDMEYTIINGTYQKATNDTKANKTRGLLEAITTNVVAASSKELNPHLLDEVMRKMRKSFAPTNNLVLVVDAITRSQITNNWAKLPGFIQPASRNVGGLAIDTLVTNFGTVGIMVHDMMPSSTAMLVNMDVLEIVEQPTPGKGNFFWEPLAKVGAADKGMLFGQMGLDYGPEWYHAKITGLSATVSDPTEAASTVNLAEGAKVITVTE